MLLTVKQEIMHKFARKSSDNYQFRFCDEMNQQKVHAFRNCLYLVLPVKPTYTIKREIYVDKTPVPKQTQTKQNCADLEVSTEMWLRIPSF